MKIAYSITESSFKNIEKYPWIEANFDIGKLGSKDTREVIRLLENAHYSSIVKCLELINTYGNQSGEIGETILHSNDIFNFQRALPELFLFSYLYDRLGNNVTAIRRIQNQSTPDISIINDDLKFLIEIYTPMDFYGYKSFKDLLVQVVKNLNIKFGFDISLEMNSTSFSFANTFPTFKEIYKWLENYEKEIILWLNSDKVGCSFECETPAKSIKLVTTLNNFNQDPLDRSIIYRESTRSTDTKLFFEIDNPEYFAKSQFGIKIKDKLQKQQAGIKKDGIIRVLAINFSLCDTSNIDFFNSERYYRNLENDIKFLVSDMNPYPPYDLVLPCELGFDCGFIQPINLSDFDNSKIDKLFATIHLNNPIKEIPTATVSEVNKIVEAMKEIDDENSH